MASFGFRRNELPRRFNGKLGFGGEPQKDSANCVNKIREDISFPSPPRKKSLQSPISVKPPQNITPSPVISTSSLSASSKPSNSAVITVTIKNSLFKRVLGSGTLSTGGPV